ncbi:MAG: hypothetical protein LBI36_07395 [Oscillospiraceae bacterium]|jgi:hypothetical protein|nr:hypothetical protein [Oscillospiraceae bacterium]
MIIEKLTESGDFTLAVSADSTREITSVYCCDLLSIVMGRAKADCAWVTVMGGINSVAVAVLTEAACVVLAENVPLDGAAKERAQQQGVTVLRTALPVFEAAARISAEITAASEIK